MSASKKDTSKKPKSSDTDNATETVADNVPVDPRLLEVIICPKTRGPLSYDKEAQELISKRAKLAYPIRNGVPVMLVNEARKL